MNRIAVIGQPLAHSISPAVLGAALGAGVRCERWETPLDQLEAQVAALRDDDVLGASVTSPCKEEIAPLLDRLDGTAEAIGAVNTVTKDGRELVGYNTDATGFARALREDAGFDARGRHCVLLGAGGAARAVAYTLVQAGASVVLLAGRTPKRLESVTKTYRPITRAGTTITWCHWLDGVFMQELPKADLLVNCTPAGTKGTESASESPLPDAYLPNDGLVFDLVYNPAETPLLKAARAKGLRAVGGLPMLVYQAAEAVRLWTRADADIAAMRAAAEAALS